MISRSTCPVVEKELVGYRGGEERFRLWIRNVMVPSGIFDFVTPLKFLDNYVLTFVSPSTFFMLSD